jgi:hypothetical protein
MLLIPLLIVGAFAVVECSISVNVRKHIRVPERHDYQVKKLTDILMR